MKFFGNFSRITWVKSINILRKSLCDDGKKVIYCRRCMSFETDGYFDTARQSLTDAGIDWQSVVKIHLTPVQAMLQIPEIDKSVFYDCGFEFILDGRGYKPSNVKCELSQKNILLLAERRLSFGMISLIKLYPNFQREWDQSSADCCMSSEGIIVVKGNWKSSPADLLP
ncbi:uncharacterized protein LOC109596026 [Aethina tumida]|uniref:uncharacterized protein LOC109596026 n=1 Tax=Aethina tumida TaxID=116153 RepID=UPI00096AE2DF|nr:uncharacterized protein LOC109596026 [Aethina tumida]